MPYTLKHLPERYPRPKPLKFSRWLVALVVMLSVSIIIMRIFGHYVENLYFWRLALGFPVALWSVLLSSRLLVWSLQDSKANALTNSENSGFFEKPVRHGVHYKC